MELPKGWLAVILLLSPTLVSGGCVDDPPVKQLICRHTDPGKLPDDFDPCLCTHLVFDKLDKEDVERAVAYRSVNPRLKLVGTIVAEGTDLSGDADLQKSWTEKILQAPYFQGVFVEFQWKDKEDSPPAKSKLLQLVKALATELDNSRSSKRANKKYERTESSSQFDENEGTGVLLRLPNQPLLLGKNYDLKKLSKYVDYFVLATENITDSSESGLTYHHSRLMGIDDILNTDSLVDLVTGLGASHDKLVLTLPASATKFTLSDPEKNMPRSPISGTPKPISQTELCKLIEEGGWTVERDEDLTAPYAFRGKTWVAFDDTTSAAIKGKYILLRDLAGASLDSIHFEDWSGACGNATSGSGKARLVRTLHEAFTNIARKPRAAQLIALQEQLHQASLLPFSADIQLSPYRIVRVVDRAGAIHVVRKEAKTVFQCSRQGYFTHPLGCNRFYRCVKFNQYSDDFTVFEYDCPAGLAFDERYEVCVWPGSLPDSAACHGSSEIAPAPRTRFACPQVEGYYADPENCRWFFACLDHRRDGSHLTAYEFRCPFGLVFNEKELVCDWPWRVHNCGSGATLLGVHGVGHLTAGDILEGRLRPSYAKVSDVHVSGGRIENVNGGLVLGTTLLSGVKDGAELRGGGDDFLDLGLFEGGGLRTGGSGAEFHQGTAGSVLNNNRQHIEDNSGQYVHDSSGDYQHENRGGGAILVAGGDGSSTLQGSQEVSGTAIGSNIDGSGAYVHDGRGDHGGEYVGGLYPSVEGIGLGSGAYAHDSSGSHGAGYIAGGKVSSLGLGQHANSGIYVAGSEGQHLNGATVGLNGMSSSTFQGKQGPSGTEGQYVQYTTGNRAGVFLAGQGARGTGAISGSYVHDSRGDHGGGYVPGLYTGGELFGEKVVFKSGVETGTYAHDPRGDRVLTGGTYVTGQQASGIGAAVLSSGASSSTLQGKHTGLGVHVSDNDGQYIHDNSGAYIHDSRGDHGTSGGAYVDGQYGRGESVGSDTGASVLTTGDSSSTFHGKQTVAEVGVSGNDGQYVLGNSGIYAHYTRGNHGVGTEAGVLTTGGSGSSFQGKLIESGAHHSGIGGQYVHDARGDHGSSGGAYVIGQYGSGGGVGVGTAGTVLATGGSTSAFHGKQTGTGDHVSGGHGQYILDNSGAYVHDGRGDHDASRGAYVARQYGSEEGGKAKLATGDLSSIFHGKQTGAGVHISKIGGQYVHDNSGVYNHDAKGNQDTSGGAYVAGQYASGLWNGIGSGSAVLTTGGLGSTFHGKQFESEAHISGIGGQYVHDANRDHSTSGAYVAGQYASGVGVGAGTTLHSASGSSSITQGRQEVSEAHVSGNEGQYIHDNSGEYVHDGRGDHGTSGGAYVVGQYASGLGVGLGYGRPVLTNGGSSSTFHGKKIGSDTFLSGSGGQYIHDNSGAYVHDARGNHGTSGGAYVVGQYASGLGIGAGSGASVLTSGDTFSTLHGKNTGSGAYVSGSRGQYVHENNGAYVHDSRGDYGTSGGAYVTGQYASGAQYGTGVGVLTTGGLSSTFHGKPAGSSIHLSGYEGKYVHDNSGAYIHDGRGDHASNENAHISGLGAYIDHGSSPRPLTYYQPAPTVTPVSLSYNSFDAAKINAGLKPVYPVTPGASIHVTTAAPHTAVHSVDTSGLNVAYPAVTARPAILKTSGFAVTTPANTIVHDVESDGRLHAVSSQPTIVTPGPTLIKTYGSDDHSHHFNNAQLSLDHGGLAVTANPSFVVSPAPTAQPAFFDVVHRFDSAKLHLASQPAVAHKTYAHHTLNQPALVTPAPISTVVHPHLVSTPSVPLNPVHIPYQKVTTPFVSQRLGPVHSAVTPTPFVSFSSTTPASSINLVDFRLKAETPVSPVVHTYNKAHLSSQVPFSQVHEIAGYTYEKPTIKFETPSRPSYVQNTVFTDFGSRRPIFPVIQPISVTSSPVIPLKPVQYIQKHLQPIVSSTIAPPINYSYQKPITSINTIEHIRPITVTSSPVVPLQPVQYIGKEVRPQFSTIAPPVLPQAPSFANYPQRNPVVPLETVSVNHPHIINYGFKSSTIAPISVTSSPIVPLKSVQYIQKHVQPIVSTSVAPSVVSYHQPIHHVSVSTPAPPVVNFGYRSQTVQPISVTSTPVVPLKPVQYIQKHVQPIVSTTVSPTFVNDISHHTLHGVSSVHPITSHHLPTVFESAPQQPLTNTPSVHLSSVHIQKEYQPIVSTTVAPPVVSYSYQHPVKPISVSSAPVVPLKPIQYIQKHVRPIVSTTVSPEIVGGYSYQQPISPVQQISLSTPSVGSLSYGIRTPTFPISSSSLPVIPLKPFQKERLPFISSTVSTPVSVSYRNPIFPADQISPISVTSTPIVPLKPVQYIQKHVLPVVSTPAPVVVSTPAPAVVSSTPSPIVFSYSYQRPVTQSPIVVSSTPAVPLSPVQYVQPSKIGAPVPSFGPSFRKPVVQNIVGYTYQRPIDSRQPFVVSTPASIINYSYRQPSISVTSPAPGTFGYSYKKPIVHAQPVTVTTPAPNVVNYGYKKTVYESPVTLNTPAPAIVGYTYQKDIELNQPLAVSTVVPHDSLSYSYKRPVLPVHSFTYTTPAPNFYDVTFSKSVSTPAPSVFNYTYKKSSVPLQPLHVTTPAPTIVGYSYRKPTERIEVSTPVLPVINYSYSTTAQPIHNIVSSPTPSIVGYSYQKPVTPDLPQVAIQGPSILGYSYRKPVVSTAAPALVSHSYVSSPVIDHTPVVGFPPNVLPAAVKSNTPLPITVSSTPAVPFNPVQYVNKVAYERPLFVDKFSTVSSTSKPIVDFSYEYQSPSVAVDGRYQAVKNAVYFGQGGSTYNSGFRSQFPEAVTVTTVRPTPNVELEDALKYKSVQDALHIGKDSLATDINLHFPERVTVTTVRPKTPDFLSDTQKYEAVKNAIYSNRFNTHVHTQYPVVPAPVPVGTSSIFEENLGANRHAAAINEGLSFGSLSAHNQISSGFGQEFNIHTTAAPATVDDLTFGLKTTGDIKLINTAPARKVVYNKPLQSYVSTGATVSDNLNIHLPQFVTSTTVQPGIELSTVQPGIDLTTAQPFVKRVRVQGPGVGGYLVRKQKVRVRPLVTTTENYPQFYSTSTLKPLFQHSTSLDFSSPTFYSTTVRPAFISTSTVSPEELEIASDYEDESAKLLEQFSGGFGDIVLNAGEQGLVSHGGALASGTTVSSLKDGEAIVGVVRKEKYNGKKAKVVVVSRLSDFNPILVGKLGAECSCKSRSNTLSLKSSAQPSRAYLPVVSTTSTLAPDHISAQHPIVDHIESSTLEVDSSPAVLEDSVVKAPTVGNTGIFSSVDCQRAGLFRHPKYCNKFYSCNWDPWKKRFTLHVFNCPIHLAYDSNLGACNWPSKGPACADDNLLV